MTWRMLFLGCFSCGLMGAGIPGQSLSAAEPVTLENVQPPAPNKTDEPLAKAYSLDKAVEFLDTASLNWQKQRQCFTCHTNYAFLYARPQVDALAPDGNDPDLLLLNGSAGTVLSFTPMPSLPQVTTGVGQSAFDLLTGSAEARLRMARGDRPTDVAGAIAAVDQVDRAIVAEAVEAGRALRI